MVESNNSCLLCSKLLYVPSETDELKQRTSANHPEMVIRVATAAMMGARSVPARPPLAAIARLACGYNRPRTPSARPALVQGSHGPLPTRARWRERGGVSGAYGTRGGYLQTAASCIGVLLCCAHAVAPMGGYTYRTRCTVYKLSVCDCGCICACVCGCDVPCPVDAYACAAGNRILMRENRPTPSRASTALYVGFSVGLGLV